MIVGVIAKVFSFLLSAPKQVKEDKPCEDHSVHIINYPMNDQSLEKLKEEIASLEEKIKKINSEDN
jgi:hypothetical protein